MNVAPHRFEVLAVEGRRYRLRVRGPSGPASAAFFLRALMDASPHLFDAAGVHPDRRFDAVFVDRHASGLIEDVRVVSSRPLEALEAERTVDVALGVEHAGGDLVVGRSWTTYAGESTQPAPPRGDGGVDLARAIAIPKHE